MDEANSSGLFAGIKSLFQSKEPVLELVAEPKPKPVVPKPQKDPWPVKEFNHENLDALVLALQAVQDPDEDDTEEETDESKKKRFMTLKEFLEG